MNLHPAFLHGVPGVGSRKSEAQWGNRKFKAMTITGKHHSQSRSSHTRARIDSKSCFEKKTMMREEEKNKQQQKHDSVGFDCFVLRFYPKTQSELRPDAVSPVTTTT